MRKILVVPALALVALALSAVPVFAQDRDCRDFLSQQEAQRFFEQAGPGDPHNLDADNDGIACEGLRRVGGRTLPDSSTAPIPRRAAASFVVLALLGAGGFALAHRRLRPGVTLS